MGPPRTGLQFENLFVRVPSAPRPEVLSAPRPSVLLRPAYSFFSPFRAPAFSFFGHFRAPALSPFRASAFYFFHTFPRSGLHFFHFSFRAPVSFFQSFPRHTSVISSRLKMCSTPSLFCFILIHFFHLPLLVPFSVVSPLRFLTISLLSSLFLSPLFVPSLLFPLFPRISHSFSLFAFSGLPSDFSLFLSLCSVVPSDFSLFLSLFFRCRFLSVFLSSLRFPLFPCFFPFSRIPQLLHGKTEACKAFRP